MTDSSKRIFLSYRRSVAQHLSLLLFLRLKERGYDVFRDYNSIGPGDFERVIKSQIAARDHFLLLLVPETLDRCNYDEKAEYPKAPNPDDWLRKEIEHAIATGRNIIPLVVDGYQWRMIEPKLTAGLEPLKRINSANLITTHDRLFDASLDVVCDEYLIIHASKPATEPEPATEEEVEEIIEASESEIVNENAVEAERYFAEGNIAYQNKDYKTAIDKYTRAIELRPDWNYPYNNRGNTYHELGSYVEALADYNQAININPNDTDTYYNRGNTYQIIRNFNEALADYDRVIELNPAYAKAYNNRGRIYHELGNYIEACNDYTKAINLNPSDVKAYYNRGITFDVLGNYTDALNDYSMAINLNSEDASYYSHRGAVYYYLGKYTDAIGDFSRAIEINPHDGMSFGNRGESYLVNHDYELAKADLKRALKLRPKNALTEARLALASYALGNITEAHALWRKAVTKDQRYMDADWVDKEYNWAEPLIEEARRLIASLKDTDE